MAQVFPFLVPLTPYFAFENREDKTVTLTHYTSKYFKKIIELIESEAAEKMQNSCPKQE